MNAIDVFSDIYHLVVVMTIWHFWHFGNTFENT